MGTLTCLGIIECLNYRAKYILIIITYRNIYNIAIIDTVNVVKLLLVCYSYGPLWLMWSVLLIDFPLSTRSAKVHLGEGVNPIWAPLAHRAFSYKRHNIKPRNKGDDKMVILLINIYDIN